MESDSDEEWEAAGGPRYEQEAKSKEGGLTSDDIAHLADAYEILTSKRALSEGEARLLSGAGVPRKALMIDEAMEELIELKHALRHLARLYNFKGDMETIFSALLIEELAQFDVEVLLVYLDYLHLPIEEHLKTDLAPEASPEDNGLGPAQVPSEAIQQRHKTISIAIFNHHVRRLQRMRTLTYVEAILFDSPDNRDDYRPEVFHYRDDDNDGVIPEEDEVLQQKPGQWFPQVGRLTIDELRRCFDFQQVYHVLMMIGSMAAGDVNKEDLGSGVRWSLTNLTSFEEIARAVISTYDSLKLDPRTYLTLSGPVSRVISEFDEAPLSINEDLWLGRELDDQEILIACQAEGIQTIQDGLPKPLNLLLEEYIVAQLSPTFISHPGKHRTRAGASRYQRTSTGKLIFDLEEDDLVYYGVRDGTSKLTIYTIEELYLAFSQSQVKVPADPLSVLENVDIPMLWDIFPTRTIARLLGVVLPHKRGCAWTSRLVEQCQAILSSPDPREHGFTVQSNCLDDLSRQSQAKKDLISSALVTMYNAGVWLVEYQEDIAMYDDYAFTEQLIRNPSSVPGEPETTGRPQAEVRDILMQVEADISLLKLEAVTFGRLKIVKTTDVELSRAETQEQVNEFQPHFTIDYEDAALDISNYIKLMEEMRFGLTKTLSLSARWLMVTASVYHKKILGHMINDIELDFEEVTLPEKQ